MRCIWCHNPEGISPESHISFMPEKCIGCGYCFRVCPHDAHKMVDGQHVLDREVCRSCGLCTKECYAKALELVGREVSVEEVLDEVLCDRRFYETSGGGLTLSGGEPLMQIEFIEALLRGAKEEGVHCCVETCGFADFARLERILPLVDLFLYDIKDIDNNRHVEFTGMPNGRILENVRSLHEHGARVLLRLPLIPGYNDREDHFQGIVALAKSLPELCGVEIMPYHALGVSKLDRMGLLRETRWAECRMPDPETVECWIARFAELGVKVRSTATTFRGQE